MTQFSIPVIEYNSPKPGAPIIPPQPAFLLNDRQLVIGLVRSILTVNSGKDSRKFLAAIVRPTLSFLIDWAKTPDLKISSDFTSVIRDFSMTTRIGELGQGVSFAYWKWERGYTWIADFGPWAKGLQPPYLGTKSPDFVMYNPLTNDLAVMEAKATLSDSHKRKMSEALRQCKDAVAHPAFNRGFGSVLTLAKKQAAVGGTLHIRDPKVSADVPKNLKYCVFRRSYASWFDLVGDDDLAAWCRQDYDGTTGIKLSIDRVEQANKKIAGQLRLIVANSIGMQPEITKFELDPEVIRALADPQAFENQDWGEFAKRISSKRSEDRESIFFPDGTKISQKQ